MANFPLKKCVTENGIERRKKHGQMEKFEPGTSRLPVHHHDHIFNCAAHNHPPTITLRTS